MTDTVFTKTADPSSENRFPRQSWREPEGVLLPSVREVAYLLWEILLVVFLIIAMQITVVHSGYVRSIFDYVDVSIAADSTHALRQLVAAQYGMTGRWPNGIPRHWRKADNDKTLYTVSGGAVTAEIPGKDGKKSRLLTFRPSVASGSVVLWVCGYALPKPGFSLVGVNSTNMDETELPGQCRNPGSPSRATTGE